jgi:2-(1,2-epoxy-1,2-dihydrophenyl)acetyl-CoA isomerase
MEYQHVLRNVEAGVLTVTMNRPEVLNSCNRRMAGELRDALETAGSDDTIRAVLLTGAGRAFCAGQDLAEAAPPDGTPAPDIGEIVRGYNALILAVRRLEKPVVAAVNGVAAGAGANLALACDIVIAADTASFIQAFVKIGLVPDTGGTYFLPRLVGLARAASLAMLGGKLPAAQAKEWGAIYDVVPAASLMTTALGLARDLATQPTRAIGFTKRALNESLANDLEAQLKLEAELQRLAARTADYKEGVRAFQEKRAPSFGGR